MMPPDAIDTFLGEALRSIRAGEQCVWPANAGRAGEALGAVWRRIDFHGSAIMLNANHQLLRDWPDPLLAHMADEARVAALWEATHAAAIGALVGALDGAGVDNLLLKGTALAYSLYDEPVMRRRGDSDLLIRPTDLDRTRAILRKSGWYRSEGAHGLNRQEGWLKESAAHFGHMVDLHWAPIDNHSLRDLLDLDDCFANRRPLPRLHPRAYRPDLAFMIVHATVNQAWHAVRGYQADGARIMAPRRLIWSLDFASLVRAMNDTDRERLVAMCEKTRFGPLVADALRGAACDLDFAVPEPLIAQLEEHALAPRFVALFQHHDPASEFWFDWRAAPDWRERVRMLAVRALPPRAHLERKYPQAANWPTAALRSRLILGALIRTGGRALRGFARRVGAA